jgi:hypothetical protein
MSEGPYQPLPAQPGTSSTASVSKSNRNSSSSINVKKFNLQEVQGLAVKAFQDAIGRAPTQQELQSFLSSLNTAERSNPTVSSGSTFTSRVTEKTGAKSASTADTTSSTSSSSTSSGGLDETQFAQNYAESMQGYSGYQKATTYFDAMLGALRGPAGGGF